MPSFLTYNFNLVDPKKGFNLSLEKARAQKILLIAAIRASSGVQRQAAESLRITPPGLRFLCIQRGISLSQGELLSPPEALGGKAEMRTFGNFPKKGLDFYAAINRFEIDCIIWAVNRAQGNQDAAARILGVSSGTLRGKIRARNITNDVRLLCRMWAERRTLLAPLLFALADFENPGYELADLLEEVREAVIGAAHTICAKSVRQQFLEKLMTPEKSRMRRAS